MNAKQTVPLAVALAPLAPAIAAFVPVLLVGGAAYLVLNWLFPDKDAEKAPEIVPVDKPESPRKVAEIPVFRRIPAEIPAKPDAVPRPAAPRIAVSSPAVQTVPKVAAPVPVTDSVIVPKIVTQSPLPPPFKRKSITREDLEKAFLSGGRELSRTAAVAELKKLGFGKTAAYAALSPDGRFHNLLACGSDGIIYWTDGE